MVGIRLAFGSFDVLPLELLLLIWSAYSHEQREGHTWTSFEFLSCFSPEWIIPSRLSYPVSHFLHRGALYRIRRESKEGHTLL